MTMLQCTMGIFSKVSQDTSGTCTALSDSDYTTVKDFFVSKFPEISSICSKLESSGYYKLCSMGIFTEYKNEEIIFSKDENANKYWFICYGDINCYENKEMNKTNLLIKTINSGKIYGDKIKEYYRFYGCARGRVIILSIDKEKFDDIIKDSNKTKLKFKISFLKKFFPHIRLYSDDVIENLFPYFVREKYFKYSRVITDGEFDECIFLIIKGEVGVVKRSIKINSNINDNLSGKSPYYWIEKFNRGDIFGGYSALKNNRSNFTVLVLSDEVEWYKITKSHWLFYFGGNNGFMPITIKSIDTNQQISHEMKINYIKNHLTDQKFIESISIYLNNENDISKKSVSIDESEVVNSLFEAWRSIENLDSKLSQFKTALLSGKSSNVKQIDIFAKMKEENEKNSGKDFSKLSGDATNRIVSRKLWYNFKEKSKSLDTINLICGVKKGSKTEQWKEIEKISNKLEGKKNKMTNFEDDITDEPRNDIANNNDNNTNNNNTSENKNLNVDMDAIKMPKKKSKHSWRNLIGEE